MNRVKCHHFMFTPKCGKHLISQMKKKKVPIIDTKLQLSSKRKT